MKYGKLFGWGIVIYAIMYLTWNGFAVYGFTEGILPRIAELIVLLVVATIAGRSLRFTSWTDILPYSICWMIEVAILDALLTYPFAGSAMYQDWNLWIGYAFLIILPLLAPLSRTLYDDSQNTI
jgi:hypothetical protein